MKKYQIGIGLIILAVSLAKFFPLNGLSTGNIAILLGLGAMAWIGVNMLMSKLLPNPAGPDFNLWKMLLTGVLGFGALFSVLISGIIDTDNRVKKELQSYGLVTDAIVVNKDYITTPGKWGKTNYTYYLTVQFQDQNGTQQQIETEVGEVEFRNAGSMRPLKINYSSRNPNIHKLLFMKD